MSTKIGRNDLCFCGSGKKYKKCCLVLEGITSPTDDLFTRYHNLLTMTKLKLEQAYQSQIKKVRNEAKQVFLRYTTEHKILDDYESFFSDWLWFDKTDSEENTLGFHYLQMHGEYLEEALRTCLSALTVSHISIYEIMAMEDELLKVKDIFTQHEIKVLVKEPFDAPASLLLGRLVHLPEASLFSGTVLVMKNDDDRMKFLLDHFNYLKSLAPDTLLNLFKFKGHIIFGLFEHAYKKVMVSLNDIRFAALDGDEINNLLLTLQNHKDYVPLYHLEDYNWFKPVNSDNSYARIAIGDGKVIISAGVLEDINNLQELVGSIITEVEFTVINSNFLSRPPALDYADMWFTIMKDQESERWFNTPIGDLEDKSPRELLSTDDGKSRLAAILDNMMAATVNDEQKDFIAYLKQKVVLS